MKLFFHKAIKFDENEVKSTSYFSSCIKKYKKWDLTFASIFGLLAFFTIVGIGIYNCFSHNTCTDGKATDERSYEDNYKENSRKAPAATFATKCSKSCDMSCSYIEYYDSLEENIISALRAIKQPCSEITLKIRVTTFEKAQLSNGWLKNIKPNVTTLEIYKCTLRQIKPQAFDGPPFKHLKTLIIRYTDITELRKNSFLGLTSLNRFHCQALSKKKLVIEEGALTDMDNLTTLQVGMFILTSKDITNLVGNKGVPQQQLQELNLNNNFIPELPKNSFNNSPSVKMVYLNESEIETIHKETFSGMKSIELLNLDSNHLTTLEAGTFDSLSNLQPEGLMLGGNKWNCTCSLQWLKDYFMNTNFINTKKPPLCDDRAPFEDVIFCPNGPTTTSSSPSSPQTESTPTSTSSTSSTNPSDPSTTSSSSSSLQTESTLISTTSTKSTTSTTSTSTSSTNPDCTEIRQKLGIEILIRCKNEISYTKYKTASNDETHRVEIIVEDHKVTLHLIELEGDPLKIKVMIPESIEILKGYNLVWTSSENKTKYGCETPLEDGLILQLERGTTYTFSVLYRCESETPLKCTFGLKTLPEWSFRTWISNEYQAVAVGVTALVAICVIGVTTLATFLCIRRYPKLIGGNKSVIIVKPKETEESASSREYEEPQYWEPSTIPSTQGYLTPKYHRYARIKYRSPLMRSISELMGSSSTSIYGQPSQWRDSHIGRQDQKLERSIKVEKIEVNAYQDYKPPLPPPNPGTSYGSSKEVPEDLMYSSV